MSDPGGFQKTGDSETPSYRGQQRRKANTGAVDELDRREVHKDRMSVTPCTGSVSLGQVPQPLLLVREGGPVGLLILEE